MPVEREPILGSVLCQFAQTKCGLRYNVVGNGVRIHTVFGELKGYIKK